MNISVETALNYLSSGFINQFDIPTTFMSHPDIINAINTYKWSSRPSLIYGWTNLVKQTLYSS